NMNDGTGNGGGVTALYRVDASGDAVTSFGTDGLASVPLTDWTAASTGWDTAEGNPTDTVWDIQLDTSGDEDRIVAFGYAPAPMSTTRMDNDRYVVRINLDDGSFDTSFADAGSFSIDFGEHNLSDGTRRGVVLPNGEIISSGYTVIGDFRHHIMLLKLDETGAPATDFGFIAGDSCGTEQGGVICSNPNLAGGGFAEAYGVVVQPDGAMITTGYGMPVADSAGATDLVSFRFTATEMDSTYAGVGALIVDSGLEERGRDVIGLEDGRIVHVGKHSAVAAIYVT